MVSSDPRDGPKPDSVEGAELFELLSVISEDEAEYIITGIAIKGTGKWYDTVFGSEKDRNQGSIKLLKVSDKSLVWAGAAGDKRGFWSPAWTKTGLNKVALRLAKKMEKEYFNGKPKN